MDGYPKWITRAAGIGPVLCADAAEEKSLLDDWDMEQLDKAEADLDAAKADADAAKAVVQVVLKPKGR